MSLTFTLVDDLIILYSIQEVYLQIFSLLNIKCCANSLVNYNSLTYADIIPEMPFYLNTLHANLKL